MSSNNVRVDSEKVTSIEQELEEAKRFFVLKKWNEAADAYAQVLELLREEYQEEDPVFAPLYHRYGQALLEHAIATSGALGGGGGSKDAFELEPTALAKVKEPVAGSSSSAQRATSSKATGTNGKVDPRFSFGGDAEESDEEESSGAAVGKKDGEDEEDDDDDLGLAFSILELARISYEKVLEDEKTATLKTVEGEEWDTITIKSQLAEVFNHLADVGLESENFEQASADYQSSLDSLIPLLQPHSRRLANAYLRLGLALEYHPDPSLQATAEKQVKGSCTTLEKRLESLKARRRVLEKDSLNGEEKLAKGQAAASNHRTNKANIEDREQVPEDGRLVAIRNDEVGGKVEEMAIFEKDDVAVMDIEQVEMEEKEVIELIKDVRLKLEDYANTALESNNKATGSSLSSSMGMTSAKEKVQQAINEALLGSSANTLGAPPSLNPDAPVNDLSLMVKKKKKQQQQPAEETKGNGKRKEINGDEGPSEITTKKSKVDESLS